MTAQVSSLNDDLEMVHEETRTLRNQSLAFEELRQENAFLREQLSAIRDDDKSNADCLQSRGKELESILDGLDRSSVASDPLDQLSDAISREAMDDCGECSDILSAENETMPWEPVATREDHCCFTDIALLTAERNELREELGRVNAMKDCLSESLEEQIEYLHTRVGSVTRERDELQIQVNELSKLVESFERLLESGDLGGPIVTSVIGDCLAIVKESQTESSRAHEEVRMLHRELELRETENATFKELLRRHMGEQDSDNE
jgi:DNA repair exonuclease SbcCD ATPase subunit